MPPTDNIKWECSAHLSRVSPASEREAAKETLATLLWRTAGDRASAETHKILWHTILHGTTETITGTLYPNAVYFRVVKRRGAQLFDERA